MDAIGIWLLVLVLLPFLLFFIRVLLMTWKSIMLTKRIKNVRNGIEVVDNPVVIYPTEAPVADYSYDVYTYVIVVFVLIAFLSITKVIVTRRQNQSRRVARRQARTGQSRQAQVSSISATVDANSTVTSDPPSTSQCDAHVKVDLPPTYDEVMKHYMEAKEAAAASCQINENVTSEATEQGPTHIDIDDTPPPRYNNI